MREDVDPLPMSVQLPACSTVLAVVALPDDESFGIGAILDAFHKAGTDTAVLCLTRGVASTPYGVTGELTAVRGMEFAATERTLGVTAVVIRDLSDGALDRVCRSALTGEVIEAARAMTADGLLIFDPSGVTGHPIKPRRPPPATLTSASIITTRVLWRRLQLLDDTEHSRSLTEAPIAQELSRKKEVR